MAKKIDLKLHNKSNRAEVYLFGDVGDSYDGFTASDVMELSGQVAGVKTLDVYINSEGGDLFEGFAIYNVFKSMKQTVNFKVQGLAASAASFIIMAGDSITMADSSWIMIHETQGVVAGNAQKIREAADTMDRMSESIADIYSDRTGIKKDELLEMMVAETWFDSADALAKGFVDEIDNTLKVAACVDPGRFLHAPKEIQADKKSLSNIKKRQAEGIARRASLLLS